MWTETPTSLSREFIFRDFSEALGFIVQVGVLAEKHNHHPTITNTYNKVKIELTTHDAGNAVTEKDKNMSLSIDTLIK